MYIYYNMSLNSSYNEKVFKVVEKIKAHILCPVTNMLLIYLFASMKLEKGHKKLLGSSSKIMLPL